MRGLRGSRSRVRYLPSRARVSRMRSRGQRFESVGKLREEAVGVSRDGGRVWSRAENRDEWSGKNDCDFRRVLPGGQDRRNADSELQRRWERYGGQSSRGLFGKVEQSRSPWNRSRSQLERRSRGGSQQMSLWQRNNGAEVDRSRTDHLGGQPSLLIRNLPWTVNPEQMRNIFKRFGPVVDVHLPRNPYTGDLKGFGFVKFLNLEDASEAQQVMNHGVIGGREIQIAVIDDHRSSPQGMYVNGEGLLSPRRESKGQYLRDPHPLAAAGRFMRKDVSLPLQTNIEQGRETGVDEEGWTVV